MFSQRFSFNFTLNYFFGFFKFHDYNKMEIPNYDSDTKNKKFKQLLRFMPKDTFRMLICGNSGSGKTNLLYHMLIEPLLYFDEIHLYAKNLDQEKYQNLMNKMNKMSRTVGYDIMNVSNDKIISIVKSETNC